jgi:preprotein translocase subunit SecF
MAVIAAAIADIIETIAMMQIFGVELSMASFGALLMLIGYSIDTDILLTTRVIRKREGALDDRIRGAFKTGMTMTLTTLAVVSAILITSTSPVLLTIASVLLFGLLADIFNTWLTNVSLIRMYAVRRGL